MKPTGKQSTPRHLLIVSSEQLLEGYGSSTALHTFLEVLLTQSDWRVTILLPAAPKDATEFPADRIRILSAGPARPRSRFWQLLCFTWSGLSCLNAVNQTRPDVAISWQPLPAGLLAWLASRRSKIPLVVRTCGPELSWHWSRFPLITILLKPFTWFLFCVANAVVVKSELERGLLPFFIDHGLVHLIPNAVSARFFVRRSNPIGRELRLLTVSQLEAYKDADKLIGAFALLGKQTGRGSRLTVVGEGSERRRLEQKVRKERLAVEFRGRVPRAQMPAVYAEHDVFLLASRYEGCSNSVLEAMAAGLPIVGTRSALSDLVDERKYGALAHTAKREQVERALQSVVRRETNNPTTNLAAREKAREHSPQRLFGNYFDLIEKLCEDS